MPLIETRSPTAAAGAGARQARNTAVAIRAVRNMGRLTRFGARLLDLRCGICALRLINVREHVSVLRAEVLWLGDLPNLTLAVASNFEEMLGHLDCVCF